MIQSLHLKTHQDFINKHGGILCNIQNPSSGYETQTGKVKNGVIRQNILLIESNQTNTQIR